MRLGDSVELHHGLQNPKGPLIGPMVICGVLVDESRLDDLKKAGVKDSKLLTPKQREAIADKILNIAADYALIIVPPEEIDKTLKSKDSNLNWLEAEKAVEIINSLDADRVVMDCPSTNIEAFYSYIAERLKKNVAVVCRHKADADYPEVAAASILAKVLRDKKISEIKDKIGKDFGSGYPSDPKTRDFLKKYWRDYPEIFRKTWISYQRVAGNNIKERSENPEKSAKTSQKRISEF